MVCSTRTAPGFAGALGFNDGFGTSTAPTRKPASSDARRPAPRCEVDHHRERPTGCGDERSHLRGGEEHRRIVHCPNVAGVVIGRQLDVVGGVSKQPTICDRLGKYLPNQKVGVADRFLPRRPHPGYPIAYVVAGDRVNRVVAEGVVDTQADEPLVPLDGVLTCRGQGVRVGSAGGVLEIVAGPEPRRCDLAEDHLARMRVDVDPPAALRLDVNGGVVLIAFRRPVAGSR
ncbi:Uncharacterised protein [Mycobacteroides abscessus subsp. abscessus]|nr:Uncharacterised protein [Mycobacteroides abscessus subsp. abscessus]SHS86442.1 Uncharacterised protein [Mycobacteroides abscessus subsp. abscessus]SHT82476.1 Uncharacterised protein [Mycobacteroides abscessus subsp. abscessus]SHV03625.1 Uncharacterised protein [Mycobacteroides abscessus subsp. abscessus]SHX33007.1 Uncharacterised protein [Mycobacteroides abscessus subsp. abscessus]